MRTHCNKMTCRENSKIATVYTSMVLNSKHCSSIYFRCKTTVLAFTLSVTATLLLTDLTSAPDDKILASNISEKCGKKYCRYPHRYCIRKVSPILASILKKYLRYYWQRYQLASCLIYASKWTSANFVDSLCPFRRSCGCVLLLNQIF